MQFEGSFRLALKCLYLAQLVFTVILLHLAGCIINGIEDGNPYPIALRLALAAGILSSLTFISSLLAFVHEVFRHPVQIWLANVFNIPCTLTAAIMLSSKLGVHDCTDNVTTLHPSLFPQL